MLLLKLLAEKSPKFRNFLAINNFCDEADFSGLSEMAIIEYINLVIILKDQEYFVSNLFFLCSPIFLTLTMINA
jgi:hypothetical protein